LVVEGHFQTDCRQRGMHFVGRKESHLMVFDQMLCPRRGAD
jgi:hypothetical protein